MQPGNFVYDKKYKDFSTKQVGYEEPDSLVVIAKTEDTIDKHVVFEESDETVADHNLTIQKKNR